MDLNNLHYRNLPDNSVICLIAPTASGKTDLGFRLYQTGRFELISVDSALIYQDMNIGTAKPTPLELANYPHHLVDIIAPTDGYNVVNFVQDCERLINDIHQRGKIPVLIGGTMMYYMAILDGISAVPPSDEQTRQAVADFHKVGGNQAVFDYLQQFDPDICKKLNPSDTQRLLRAMEVHKQTNKPLSLWQQLPKQSLTQNPKWQWQILTVMPDRAWLHSRIERRLERMWQAGFVDEVVALLQKYPLTPDMPSMRCVGYRQVLEFLCITKHPVTQNFGINGEDFAVDLKNNACQVMKNRALYATRQLAKRQCTWIRQLSLLGSPTRQLPHNNLNIATFDAIQQLQGQIL